MPGDRTASTPARRLFARPRRRDGYATWLRGLALLALTSACARSVPAAELEILAITTAATPVPRSTIGVVMVVVSHAPAPIAVTRTALTVEPEVEGTRVREVDPFPVSLEPNATESLDFAVTLPAGYERLVVDGEISGILEGGSRVVTAAGADSPLVIDYGDRGPGSTDLVVSASDDELDGGAGVSSVAAAGGSADLSLREAVEIANARAGPDLILFDAGAFGETSPGVIVQDSAVGPFAVYDDGTVIDATDRSVVIAPTQNGGPVITVAANEVEIRHLTVRGVYKAFTLTNAGNAVIADNSLHTQSSSTNVGAVMADNTPGLIVTGNYIGGSVVGIDVANSDRGVIIIGNDIATGSYGLRLSHVTGASITDNAFVSNDIAVIFSLTDHVRFEANRLSDTGNGCVRLERASDANVIVGNRFETCGDASGEAAIWIRETSRYNTVTHNSIAFGYGGSLRFDAGTQEGVAPPVIGSAAGGIVAGSSGAAVGSVVEVFAGGGEFPAVYLGSGTVDGDGNWSVTLAPAPSSGSAVLATVTTPNGSTSTVSAPAVVP